MLINTLQPNENCGTPPECGAALGKTNLPDIGGKTFSRKGDRGKRGGVGGVPVW